MKKTIVLILALSFWGPGMYASGFPSDLEMSNPIENLQTGEQWLKDDASTGVCAAEIRDYHFCLNTHNKANLGYDCYVEQMDLKRCWDRYRQQRCRTLRMDYTLYSNRGNFQSAEKVLEAAKGCAWQPGEKRNFRCNQNGRYFGRALSQSRYDLCKQILPKSRDCDWYDKGRRDLYHRINGPGSSSHVPLGYRWVEHESGWTGIWTRRGTSNVFDAFWTKGGSQERAVLTITIQGRQVRVERTQQKGKCRYQGSVAADNMTVSGTYSCDWSKGPHSWGALLR